MLRVGLQRMSYDKEVLGELALYLLGNLPNFEFQLGNTPSASGRRYVPLSVCVYYMLYSVANRFIRYGGIHFCVSFTVTCSEAAIDR